MTESMAFDFGGVIPSVTATPANPSPMLGLTVYFRGSTYGYAGVWWGDGNVAPASGAASLPPYTATYTDQNGVVTTFDVGKNGRPPHWWGTRWRTKVPGLNGAPLNVKNSIASLKTLGIVQNYRDMSPNDPFPPKPITSYNFPLDPGGVTKAESNTGERWDIGDYSEFDANAAMTGDMTPSIAYNENLNATAMFYLDNGRFLDFIKTPPNVVFPRVKPPSIDASKQINWDVGHDPMAGTLPALVTEDPWYLEMVQANAQTAITFSAGFRYGLEWPTSKTAVATWPPGQIRGYFYCGRNIVAAYIVTKFFEDRGILPSTCLPSSVYATQLTNQALAADDFWINNPAVSIFGFHPTYNLPSPWQTDKGAPVLCIGARFLPALKKYAEWNFRSLWFRVNGISGWPPCMSSIYCLQAMPGASIAPPLDNKNGTMSNPKALLPSQFFANAADMWAFNANLIKTSGGAGNVTPVQVDQANADQWNGGNWIQENTFDHFIQHTAFAAYVDAMRAGVLDLSQYAPAWMIEQAYANQHAMAVAININNRIEARQSAWVDPIYKPNFNIRPGQPYPTPVPVSSTPLPPAGGIHMSNPGDLLVGQSAHFTLTYDDGHGNPSQSPVNLKVVVSPPGAVTIAPDATGGVATGAVPGPYSITATADNCQPVSISGSVALPLAGALHLAWG